MNVLAGVILICNDIAHITLANNVSTNFLQAND